MYVIVSDSGNGQRFWYVGGKHWSDERPDAKEFKSKAVAVDIIRDMQLKYPPHLTWSKAKVVDILQ